MNARAALFLTATFAGSVILLAVVALAPSHYESHRHVVLGVSRGDVESYVADLRAWRTWSAWDELGVNGAREYSPTTTGVGAWYTWGGGGIGSGRAEILSVAQNEVLCALTLGGSRGDTTHARLRINVDSVEEGTNVTMTLDGDHDANLPQKIFGLAVSAGLMVGDADRGRGERLERALRNLAIQLNAPATPVE